MYKHGHHKSIILKSVIKDFSSPKDFFVGDLLLDVHHWIVDGNYSEIYLSFVSKSVTRIFHTFCGSDKFVQRIILAFTEACDIEVDSEEWSLIIGSGEIGPSSTEASSKNITYYRAGKFRVGNMNQKVSSIDLKNQELHMFEGLLHEKYKSQLDELLDELFDDSKN